jgi:hypothetical protein
MESDMPNLTVTIEYGAERHVMPVPVYAYTDASLDRIHELLGIIAGRARRAGRGGVLEENVKLLAYEQEATLRRLAELDRAAPAK